MRTRLSAAAIVNAATDSSFREGRIMLQSEGAEIYFRRIDLEPLQ